MFYQKMIRAQLSITSKMKKNLENYRQDGS